MILRCENLSKSFGGNKAVDKVSLTIKRLGISSIIGPNGAGKTTLFNLITGYLPTDTGRIWFKDTEITGLPSYKISQLGIVRTFQGSNLFSRMTVFENVQVALFSRSGQTATLNKRARELFRPEVEEILESVDLANSSHVPSGILSGGNKKRLELAIALAVGSQMLLLDEPTAGVELKDTVNITRLIEKLTREKKIKAIFIEHDMNVVFAISEKIRVMHQGSILAEGTPEEVRRNPEVQTAYLGWDT